MFEASLLGGHVFHRFDKLRWLSLELTCDLEGLFELLRAAPSLEFLKIDVINFQYDCDLYTRRHLPSCIISHLKEVEFENYEFENYDSENYEFENNGYTLAVFLLKNAKELKKILFKGGFSTDEQNIIKEELSTLCRFQTDLTIDFVDMPYPRCRGYDVALTFSYRGFC